MNLFNQQQNILPFDGSVFYIPHVFTADKCNYFTNTLLQNIEWKNDELIMFGKHITTKRKAAWYANDGLSYTYSKVKKQALAFTPELLQLKTIAEQKCDCTFNSCLLNLYHNGTEAMGWHSDDEKELLPNGTIASISFGADRKFVFRHKTTKQTVNIILQNGSLLSMQDVTQTHWQHRLAPSTTIKQPRINLTFRTIVENN